MSSEIRDRNFNDDPNEVEGKTQLNSEEKRRDIDKISNDVNLVVKEASEIMIANEHSPRVDGCDSEQLVSEQHRKDPNLNTVAVVRTTADEIASCDVHSVENLSNALAEKENRKHLTDNDTENCSRAEASQSGVKYKNIREMLIHKVNELDISGRVNQNSQNNKSTVILKKETDSLKNLLVYDNSSDEEDVFEKNWQLLTVPDSCSDSESDSDDSIDSSSDDTNDVSSHIIFGQKDKGAIKKTSSPFKPSLDENIKGLPPVPDLSNLNINYEKEEFLHMGTIQAIIETLVTVEALPATPAYDLDSYLFVEDKTTKKPLGVIYDVIGPVTAPIYCIRFNTTKDIQDLNLKQGLKVFSAPKSQYTHYVFVKELMRHKGSDASWVGDAELPPEVAAEMSDEDEEEEADGDTARKAQKRKHGSLERYKQFEKSMNRCNTLNTRVAQLVDAHRRLPRPVRYNSDHPQRPVAGDLGLFGHRFPAPFDPSVPPPGFHEYPRHAPGPRPPAPWGWLPPEAFRPPGGPPNAAPFMHGQNNSANYYTNNAGRSHAAGPSSQPY